MAQVLQHLPSKHKTLAFNPSTVGASLAIFLGFTVSGIHLGFATLCLQAAFY
jgi:hypothetical protein